MYQVIKQLKSSFAVLSALFITVISSRVRSHQNCDNNAFLQCSRPLSVLTDNGLAFASTKSDLGKICPDLKDAIHCIHSHARLCMNFQSRRHFKNMFHSTGLMINELCKEGSFQEEYLRHAPCMKKGVNDNNVCLARYANEMSQIQAQSHNVTATDTEVPNASEADIYYKRKREAAANAGIKSICCAFQGFVECSTSTIRRTCGEDAAAFSYNFLNRMSNAMLQQHCTEFDRKVCGLPSLAASSSSSYSWCIFLVVIPFLVGWL